MTKRLLSKDEIDYLETEQQIENDLENREPFVDNRRVKHQVKKKANELSDTIFHFANDLKLLTGFVNGELDEETRNRIILELSNKPDILSTIAELLQSWTPSNRGKDLLLKLFNGEADWKDDGMGFTVDDIICTFSEYISNIRFENSSIEESRNLALESLKMLAHEIRGKRFYQYDIGRGGLFVDDSTHVVYSFPNLLIETSREALEASRWLVRGRKVWIAYEADPVPIESHKGPETYSMTLKVNIPLMLLRSNPVFHEDYALARIDHPFKLTSIEKTIPSWECALEELVNILENEPLRAILHNGDGRIKVVRQEMLRDRDFVDWHKAQGFSIITEKQNFQSIIKKIEGQIKDPRGGASTLQRASIREMVTMGLFTKGRKGLRITKLGKEVNRLLGNERFIRLIDE